MREKYGWNQPEPWMQHVAILNALRGDHMVFEDGIIIPS